MHVIGLKRVLSAFFSAVFAELDLLSSEQADYMDKIYILEIFLEKKIFLSFKKMLKITMKHHEVHEEGLCFQ